MNRMQNHGTWTHQNQAQISEQQAQIDQVEQRFKANQRASVLLQKRLTKDRNEVQRYQKLVQCPVAQVGIVVMRSRSR